MVKKHRKPSPPPLEHIYWGADVPMRERIPGARGQRHVTIGGAGHFVQEDAGEELGRVIAGFVLG